jgi:cytochrome c peroxidase
LRQTNYIFILLFAILSSCVEDEIIELVSVYNPTAYSLDVPNGFPNPNIPSQNPMTEEGVELGKKLFYDPILSGNNTLSCADCHFQESAFSDPVRFSVGIEGVEGEFNASSLINVAWNTSHFWDGRSASLEEQAFGPVTSFIELHSSSWKEVTDRLNQSSTYKLLFEKAFDIKTIDSLYVVRAIAQFERTLISGNSKYDQFVDNKVSLSASELRGLEIFNTEKGDCFHCHSYPLFTSNDFHNNGIDMEGMLKDGRQAVTNDIYDKGKFKSPTLRNIELTSPYMHDGRFSTLEEVIEHYNFGGHESYTIDPNMKKVGIGLGLNSQNKTDLISFLKTLTDSSFINNTDFQP